MPTINIPPLVRFVLYIVGALALLFVAYAVDKSWAGDAEVRLVTGVVALLQLLAAAKTNLSDGKTFEIQGTVTDDVTGQTGTVQAAVEPDAERGAISWVEATLIVVVVVVILIIFGVIGVR